MLGRIARLLPFLLVLLLFRPNLASAHHFRYGTISWAPVPGAAPGTVKIRLVQAFKRDVGAPGGADTGPPFAFNGSGADGLAVTGDIVQYATSNLDFGDGTFAPSDPKKGLFYRVTAYSVKQDYIICEALDPADATNKTYGITHTYAQRAQPYIAGQPSSASTRIAELNNRANAPYAIVTTIDPFKGNSSPVVSLSPVNVLPANSDISFKVRASDPNGDRLKFLLATDKQAGDPNGAATTSPMGMAVDPQTGVVTWHTPAQDLVNFWTAQIIVEDLDSQGNPKSEVPVDFLLRVLNPVGTAPTVSVDNQATDIFGAPGTPITFTVTATDPDANATIELNDNGLPPGAVMIPGVPVTGGSGVNSMFSWTPTTDQVGTFVVDFIGTDNNGLQGEAPISIHVGPPDAPSGLTARAGDGVVNLNWASSPGAVSHNIMRSTTAGGPYTLIQSGVMTTNYSDTTVANLTTYYYVVSAVNLIGEGPNSNEASATPAPGPPAPTGLVATSGSPILLRWNPVPLSSYTVERSDVSGSGYTPVAGGSGVTATSFADASAANGHTYYYVVFATNPNGIAGPTSNEAPGTTPPAAPSNLQVSSVTSSSASLVWQDTSLNGTTSKLTRTVGTTTTVIPVGLVSTTTFTDLNLRPNTQYTYSVQSSNAVGDSPPSNQVVALTLPVAASNLSAVAAAGPGVNLSWQRNNTVNPFVEYRVERQATGSPYVAVALLGSANSTFTDTAVNANTQYNYRIVATNASGDAAASNVVSVSIPPSAPTGLTGRATSSSSVHLAWIDNTGGVAGYDVLRASAGGAFTVLSTVPAGGRTLFDDTQLAAGTPYMYEVRATTSVGVSAIAGPITVVTTQSAPNAPGPVTAVAVSTTQIDLFWPPGPSDAVSFQIQRVDATSTRTIATVPASVHAFSVTGLAVNTAYTFQITAQNSGGTSEASQPVTAYTQPRPPINVVATATSATQIKLTWSDPNNSLSSYRVERKNASGTFDVVMSLPNGSSSFVDNGLQPQVQYTYRVFATNPGSDSAPSSEVSATTTLLAPGTLVATVLPDRIRLTWTDTNSQLATYRVDRATAGGDFVAIGSPTEGGPGSPPPFTFDDTSVQPHTVYTYRVVPIGPAGVGTAAGPVTATTRGIAPTNLTVTASGPGALTLTWTDTNAGATGYVIGVVNGESVTFSQTVGAGITTFTDTGLPANTTKTYVVASSNAGGQSDASAAASGTTLPSAPTSVAVSGGVTSATVTWTDTDAGLVSFKIQRSAAGGEFQQVGTTAAGVTTFTDTSISPATAYTYRVIASTSVGDSAPSSPASFSPAALFIFPAGISMVSLPYDYSTSGADAAALFGVNTGIDGTALIATFNPLTNSYLLYPNLPGGNGKQPQVGRGYWIKETIPHPFLSPGTVVHGPLDLQLQTGWNMIGDPFVSAVNVGALQVIAPFAVGGNAANTPISEQTAVDNHLLGATVWAYSPTQNQYVAATSLQPYGGFWVYVDPTVSQNGPVTLRIPGQ